MKKINEKGILLLYLFSDKHNNLNKLNDYKISMEKQEILDESSVIPRIKILITIIYKDMMLNRYWINCNYDVSTKNIIRLIEIYYSNKY